MGKVRITHRLLYDTIKLNIQKNQQASYRTQEQLVSGRQINRPSDDPIGAARAIELKKTLSRIEQFKRNIDQADSFLTATETALSNIQNNMQRVRDIVMQQLNGGQSEEGRQGAIAELTEVRNTILQSMNTKSGGRFIFSGYQTQDEAFDASGNFQGISGQIIEVEIADGDFIAMNITGDRPFVDSGSGQSTIQLIDAIIADLTTEDMDSLRDKLPQINDFNDQILNSISNVGARTNRLDDAETFNEDISVATVGILSDIEDLDYSEATTKFAEQERVLQATLEVSSRVMSMSLLDFLR